MRISWVDLVRVASSYPPCPALTLGWDLCDASYHINSILNELRDLDSGLRPARVKGYSGKALSYSLILCIEDHTAFFWATLSIFNDTSVVP